MEQARKRLVQLLSESDYITSKDSRHDWWESRVTVGASNYNSEYYEYHYSINENNFGRKGTFYIDRASIASALITEFNLTKRDIRILVTNTLSERYNFGNITAFANSY